MASPVEESHHQIPVKDIDHPDEKKPQDVEKSSAKGISLITEVNSIYADVRAAVPAEDHDVPVSTLRAWLLGTITTVFMAGFVQLFNLHNPPLSLSPYIMILVMFPIGKLLGRVTPNASFSILGQKIELNPGPFNYKEHTIIAIMAIGSTGYDSGALATYVWTAMIKKMDMEVSIGFRLLFQLSVQGIAFGLAGIFQKLLVDPAYCVWPTALPTCTLIHGLHDSTLLTNIQSRWKISPMRFFWFTLAGVAVWHFLPGFLFTSLSYFAWVTWIAPNNVTINQVFGSWSGMDLMPMTLDWNQIISYQYSPLVTPLWAILNVLGGCVFFLWVLSPILHWSNVWYGKYLPFSSSSLFDNTGSSYNVTRILTSDMSLNSTAYHEYSPVYLSTTMALSYGLGFGAVTSVVVYAALHYRKEMWFGIKATIMNKGTKTLDEDIHVKPQMMRKYKPTPTWWYGLSMILIIALAIWFAEAMVPGLPWWGIILSVCINLVVFLPIAILAATCNQGISTNVVSAFMAGYIWPGKIIANVVFKCITFNALGTALVLARDQKLGLYMHLPPRVVFWAQAIGITINWLTQVGVNAWALNNIEGVCTKSAIGKFTCPISSSFQSSMTFWGAVGPSKLFSDGALYQPMLWFFLIGAVLPVLVYVAAKKFPQQKWLQKVNVPLIMSSIAAIPPATAINFIPWALTGLVFQGYLRSRANNWWRKYNFLLSAALDGGLAICSFFVFFCLSYPGVTLSWWGNDVETYTADYQGTPLLTLPEGETFGPKSWL